MPIYFGEVAPYCPISRDQPVGPMSAPTIRTNVPIARDLASAIAAANILRSIITQLVFDKTINNIYSAPTPKPRTQPVDRVINKKRSSRWSEVTQSRIKRKYKYYYKDADGVEDKDIWVMTERIEQMVWNDKGWRTTLVFTYGDKYEGHPVGIPAGTTGGPDFETGDFSQGL